MKKFTLRTVKKKSVLCTPFFITAYGVTEKINADNFLLSVHNSLLSVLNILTFGTEIVFEKFEKTLKIYILLVIFQKQFIDDFSSCVTHDYKFL